MAAKQKGLLYIKRTGLDYFSPERTDILHLVFPPTTIQDMEVVNKEELLQLLQNFVTTNKIIPSRSIIVLSDTIFFQKDIAVAKPEELEPQVKSFLNNVPFEHVIFKTFDIDKAKRVLAANKDLYQYVKEYLEKNGFTLPLVIASLSLGKDFTLGENITVEQAKAIIQKMDAIKPTENFLEPPKPTVESEKNQQYTPIAKKKKTAKSTLPILLPVFGLLIATLVGVFYMQSKQNSAALAARAALRLTPSPIIVPSDTPTPEPTVPISSESAALQKKATKIQILNGSRIAGQAEKERRALTAIGYADVKTSNAVGATADHTLIIFAKKVPDYIRDDIISHLKKTYEEITSQEIDQAEFDVIVTLGELLGTTPTVTP
jgi:hypothetical protein